MKPQNKILLVLIVGFGFFMGAGCGKQSVPNKTLSTHTTDTVVIKQVSIKLDTVIKTEADTLILVDTVNCNDAKVQVATKEGKVEATIHKGVLRVKSYRTSKIIPISIEKKVQVADTKSTTIKEVPVEIIKIKKRVPTWCWWLLAYNIFQLLYMFRSPILAFLKGFKR